MMRITSSLAIAILCGCADNSTQEVMPTRSAGAMASAGSGGVLAVAEKCPQIPRVQGFTFNSCCQSDNMCGVDGSSLNRGCLSYSAVKKFFNFAPPPLTTCDGIPVPAAESSSAGAGGATATR